jgi:hypothetical protein
MPAARAVLALAAGAAFCSMNASGRIACGRRQSPFPDKFKLGNRTRTALHRDEVLTDALNEERSEKGFEILVDMTRGIAFEFRNGATADPNTGGYCAAIQVFRPGTEPRVMDALDQR